MGGGRLSSFHDYEEARISPEHLRIMDDEFAGEPAQRLALRPVRILSCNDSVGDRGLGEIDDGVSAHSQRAKQVRLEWKNRNQGLSNSNDPATFTNDAGTRELSGATYRNVNAFLSLDVLRQRYLESIGGALVRLTDMRKRIE